MARTMRLKAEAWTCLAVGLLLAAASALAGRGTFEHRIVTGVIVATGFLLLIAGTLAQRVIGVRRLWLRWIGRVALFSSVICVMQIAAFASGWLIHRRDVTTARVFCEQVVARLEDIRRSRGSYPANLEDVVGGSMAMPYLFLRSGAFVSTGDAFVLSFDEADGVIPHVLHYASDRPGWTRF